MNLPPTRSSLPPVFTSASQPADHPLASTTGDLPAALSVDGVSSRDRPGRRGSVLLIVLVMLVFACGAVVLFIEKAGTDLLVVIRDADAGRLRLEAYSALETTLAVLEDFRSVGDGLHSPAEGWSDPLGFAAYEAGEGRTVEVTFEDESAKLPLPSVKAEMLTALFKYWGLPQTDSERLTDSLLGWIKKDYTPTAIGAPTTADYENAALGFTPPARSLRSFAELSSIEGIRQAFFDESGNPNELYRKFTETFSLYRYRSPNINGNRLDPLLAQEVFDAQQQLRVTEYLTGAGSYQTQGPGFFKTTRSVEAVSGGQVARLGYGVTIQALRIIVTVRQGPSSFRLSVVVAPDGGAKAVPASNVTINDNTSTSGNTASTGGTQTSTATTGSQTGTQTAAQPSTSQSNSPTTAVPDPIDLKYPFTFLEIRENDVTVPPLAPSDAPTA